jgi:hypothetical protein
MGRDKAREQAKKRRVESVLTFCRGDKKIRKVSLPFTRAGERAYGNNVVAIKVYSYVIKTPKRCS